MLALITVATAMKVFGAWGAGEDDHESEDPSKDVLMFYEINGGIANLDT